MGKPSKKGRRPEALVTPTDLLTIDLLLPGATADAKYLTISPCLANNVRTPGAVDRLLVMGDLHALPGIAEDDAPVYDTGSERRAPFVMIPDAVRQLKNPYATQVYFALMMRANRERTCWPSHACIAEDSGVSARKVREMLRLLEAHGMIRTDHGRHTNYYFLVEPENIPSVVTRHVVPPENVNKGTGHSARGAAHSAPHAGHSARGAVQAARGADKPDTRTKLQELDSKNQSVSANAETAPQAAPAKPAKPSKPAKAPKPKRTQSETERLAFVMVDAFARGGDRLPKDVAGKERYDARKAFEPLTDRYSPDDIEDCTRYLRSKPFWQDGNLSAVHVAKALPDWIAKGRPERAADAVETFDGEPVFDTKGNPTTAYWKRELVQNAERDSA